MRGRPARSRLLCKRPQVAAPVRQEFDLLVQMVGGAQRVVEQVLVHGQERWGEGRRVAARQRVLVVGGGHDQSVLVVALFDGPQELVTPGQLLEPSLWYAQREIYQQLPRRHQFLRAVEEGDRKSTRLNSSHRTISYAVFC